MKCNFLFRLIVPVLALSLGSAVAVSAAPAAPGGPGGVVGSNNGPIKIAVANPSRIFNEMQETKTLQAKLAEDQKKFSDTQKEKLAALDQIKSQRDGLNPAHPQYEALNNQLMEQSLQYKVWLETQKAMAEHTQKRQMKVLFEKIQGAITEIAKRDGIDLVLADSKEPLPSEAELDQISIQVLRGAILQKNVLYATDRIDLSQAVLALLDARYKAAGSGAVQAPAAVNPAGANK